MRQRACSGIYVKAANSKKEYLKMKHLHNGNKGFTLVEVIVVSVIVAVLAAVAIPLYIGYINDSATNQANNEAANFATAVANVVNSGATAVNGWAASMTNLVVTWTVPGVGTTANPPSIRIPAGTTITIASGTGLASGGCCTATVRGKVSGQSCW
jgi:type IV pilus assembly protein PilA